MMKSGVKEAFEKALKLLKYRDRTCYEMRQKLRERNYAKATIEEVIKSLKKLRYLDDQVYAERWIQNKLRARPIGRKLLKSRLRLKGIHPEIIDQALDKHYPDAIEIEKIVQLAENQIRKYKHQDQNVIKRKLFGFLTRRGFDSQESSEAIEKILKYENDCG